MLGHLGDRVRLATRKFGMVGKKLGKAWGVMNKAGSEKNKRIKPRKRPDFYGETGIMGIMP